MAKLEGLAYFSDLLSDPPHEQRPPFLLPPTFEHGILEVNNTKGREITVGESARDRHTRV